MKEVIDFFAKLISIVKKPFNICLLILFFLQKTNIVLAQETENLPPKRFVLFIQQVLPDSAAEKASLIENDIIYSINNKIFYDSNSTSLAHDFISFVKSLPSGSHDVVVLRKGEKLQLKVKLPDSKKLGIVVEVLENNPQLYFDNALSSLKQASSRNDLKMVASLFEKAKALSPEWEDVYYNLGTIYEKLDYYDKATDNFIKYMQFAIRRNAPFEEVEKIAALVGKNRKKQERLTDIKSKMLEGQWILVKKIPQSKIKALLEPFPRFKFDKSGKMLMQNPLAEWGKSIGNDPQSEIIRKNLKKIPWIPVKFDGKYFEIRWAEVYQGEENNKPFFWPSFILVRGEIDFRAATPIIIIRIYIHNKFDSLSGDNDNFEKVSQLAFESIEVYIFDELGDFRYELHFEIK